VSETRSQKRWKEGRKAEKQEGREKEGRLIN
jgi:hypothetical protein